jgi:hypothetical protein
VYRPEESAVAEHDFDLGHHILNDRNEQITCKKIKEETKCC